MLVLVKPEAIYDFNLFSTGHRDNKNLPVEHVQHPKHHGHLAGHTGGPMQLSTDVTNIWTRYVLKLT